MRETGAKYLRQAPAIMPRYFFDATDGDQISRDDVGILLDGPDEARAEAVKALPDMARDVLPDGQYRKLAVSVRTPDSGILFRASLTFKCEWLG
jgi:hypothetical protein